MTPCVCVYECVSVSQLSGSCEWDSWIHIQVFEGVQNVAEHEITSQSLRSRISSRSSLRGRKPNLNRAARGDGDHPEPDRQISD